jgi:hypothetical protein
MDEATKLLKGASSHWINENNLVPGKFGWARGYGAFSVSQSAFQGVAKYIASQEDHHRKKGFAEELQALVEKYGLVWRDEDRPGDGETVVWRDEDRPGDRKTVETVSHGAADSLAPG